LTKRSLQSLFLGDAMKELEAIVEAIVKEGQSWSGETPNNPWYRNQISPLVQAAFELGRNEEKK
jgi:hypothetical protein